MCTGKHRNARTHAPIVVRVQVPVARAGGQLPRRRQRVGRIKVIAEHAEEARVGRARLDVVVEADELVRVQTHLR